MYLHDKSFFIMRCSNHIKEQTTETLRILIGNFCCHQVAVIISKNKLLKQQPAKGINYVGCCSNHIKEQTTETEIDSCFRFVCKLQ